MYKTKRGEQDKERGEQRSIYPSILRGKLWRSYTRATGSRIRDELCGVVVGSEEDSVALADRRSRWVRINCTMRHDTAEFS